MIFLNSGFLNELKEKSTIMFFVAALLLRSKIITLMNSIQNKNGTVQTPESDKYSYWVDNETI